MRIGNYTIRPDTHCWVVARIKTRSEDAETDPGKEYEADHKYPGRFDQALRTLLDRMVKDGLTPDDSLSDAVATVAHLYRTIGEHVSAENALRQARER